MFGRHQRAHHWTHRAGVDFDVGPPGKFTDPPRVFLGERNADIAGDGGDGDDLEFGRAECQHDRQRVVLAGIGVDDD